MNRRTAHYFAKTEYMRIARVWKEKGNTEHVTRLVAKARDAWREYRKLVNKSGQ
jgi:hypothetical protein